jgi:hypothetical protein
LDCELGEEGDQRVFELEATAGRSEVEVDAPPA